MSAEVPLTDPLTASHTKRRVEILSAEEAEYCRVVLSSSKTNTRKLLRIILVQSQDQVQVSMTTRTSYHECLQRTQRMELMNRWASVSKIVVRYCIRARVWKWLEKLLQLQHRRQEAVDLLSLAACQVQEIILNSSEIQKLIRLQHVCWLVNKISKCSIKIVWRIHKMQVGITNLNYQL